jgi:hypothetical protein
MKIKCPLCKGTTRHFSYPYSERCPVCEGLAELTISGNPTLKTCPDCKGNGRDFAYPNTELCPTCHGIAYLTEDDIPPTILKRRQAPPLSPVPPSGGLTLIADSRIDKLRSLKATRLDFQKLIRLCEELNTVYSQGCYLATIMLTRSLLDHVPPVFGKKKFTEVANNYGDGGKSFTEAMQQLEAAARKIANAYLHMFMRANETVPTAQQVNFGPQLDKFRSQSPGGFLTVSNFFGTKPV